MVFYSNNHFFHSLYTLGTEFAKEIFKFGTKGCWNLRVQDGHNFINYNCKLLNPKKYLAKFGFGWKGFCRANNLKEDDNCIFTNLFGPDNVRFHRTWCFFVPSPSTLLFSLFNMTLCILYNYLKYPCQLLINCILWILYFDYFNCTFMHLIIYTYTSFFTN